MTTSTPDNNSTTRSRDAEWFAAAWLRGTPDEAVQTIPVIAVVQELLTVLRDEQVPEPDAYRTLCRAVRLLSVFAAEPPAKQHTQSGEDQYLRGLRTHVFAVDDIADSEQSWRFAKETLHGSPRRAIRTEPVIAVVADLHAMLLYGGPTQPAHTAVRRAVRLLSVYTIDDDHEHCPHPAG
ncbi:hypothetical protein [Dactylosporangium sp. CA-092794]|uniref:hypothetical protein n=1 Tax=Dactylosporangium sp. CA-092794 TaxID=3239929 RepID=UPI003D8A72FB